MKRNWDLIRRILFKLEEKAVPEDFLMSDQIQGFDRATVAYHFKLLHQAGLIEGMDNSSIGQFDFYVTGLTWQGHEFLDNIRNDTLWQKVKATVQSKSLDLSFDVIKTVATNLISFAL